MAEAVPGSVAAATLYGSTARFPYYQVTPQQHIARWQVRIRNPVKHGRHGNPANVPAGLMQGCERNGQQTRIFHVIDPHDPNVFGESFDQAT